MSKSRTRIHVVPNNGNWAVKKNGQVVSNHHKKENAVQSGITTAKKQPSSQVVIHKKNGQIQTEHTYGKDPYPPEG
jgi:hypothetical protein